MNNSALSKRALERIRRFHEHVTADAIARERDEVAEKLAEALRERHDPIDCRIGPNCSACKALAAYRERMGR